LILSPIAPEQLHTVWPWVREGLETIRRKRDESWLPEDVYLQLRSKTAHLMVIEDAGFLIYQILPGDDFRGVLHVWCVWGALKDYERQIYDELEAYARQLKVARIRAVGRKGWARRGFFSLIGYVYERVIQ